MTDPALRNVDRFGCSSPGWEPEEKNGCHSCGATDIDKEGWCPRCNEEYGDRDKQREDLAPLA